MISATVIEHNVSPKGVQMITAIWEYPRFIHGEVMTHRQLSKNASSSRAIPAKNVREQVWHRPAMPLRYGANQSGMQAKEDLPTSKQNICATLWKAAAKVACGFHFVMEKVGLHKQLCNRILEPWMQMRIVVSGTEWANFLWLRDHKDAQPEIQELARQFFLAMTKSTPRRLNFGEYHLPFVSAYDREILTLEEQLKLSVSCCAQASFRALDYSMQKALKIDGMLKDGDRLHASPFEHQALCIDVDAIESKSQAKAAGFTHQDVDGDLWSGNLRGWVQHRQTLDGHNVTSMDKYRKYVESKLAA